MWGGNGSSSYLSLTAEFPDVICHTSAGSIQCSVLIKEVILVRHTKRKIRFFWHRDSNNSICRDSEDYKNDQPTNHLVVVFTFETDGFLL